MRIIGPEKIVKIKKPLGSKYCSLEKNLQCHIKITRNIVTSVARELLQIAIILECKWW